MYEALFALGALLMAFLVGWTGRAWRDEGRKAERAKRTLDAQKKVSEDVRKKSLDEIVRELSRS